MGCEWPILSISEIASPESGGIAIGPFGSRMKSDCYVADGVRVVRGNNLTGGRTFSENFVFVTLDKARSLGSSLLKPNDVVFPHRGSIGEVGIVPSDGRTYVMSTSLMKLTCDLSKVNPFFVYYFFKSQQGKDALLANKSQVGTPGIGQPLTSLKSIRMTVPPLSDQTAIVAMLDALDQRIESVQQSSWTCEAIARAVFKSWFVDFDPVRAKAEGREPEGMDAATAALFPNELFESKAGPLPVGWLPDCLGSISQVGIGKTPPRAQSEWFSESPSDLVWVSIRDMGRSGIYIGNSSERLTREAVGKFNVRVVPDNTVILSFKMTVGRVAITYGELTTNEAIAHCVLDGNARVSPEYLYCALSGFNFASLSSTSSIANAVNSKGVRDIAITLPPRPLADAFSDTITPLFKAIKNNQARVATLSELRDTLLPRLISGKLRIPEAEKLMEAVL